jgi:hypothetical protein
MARCELGSDITRVDDELFACLDEKLFDAACRIGTSKFRGHSASMGIRKKSWTMRGFLLWGFGHVGISQTIAREIDLSILAVLRVSPEKEDALPAQQTLDSQRLCFRFHV